MSFGVALPFFEDDGRLFLRFRDIAEIPAVQKAVVDFWDAFEPPVIWRQRLYLKAAR